jgi:hypothetical protein
MRRAIVDTGPLVALLTGPKRITAGLLDKSRSCSGRYSSANQHLLARFSQGQDALFKLLENGALHIALRIDENIAALHQLHQKYRDRPMSSV